MQTNRELYNVVRALASQHGTTERTLEQYLCALWSLARELREVPTLTLTAFAALLDNAFTSPPGTPALDAIATGDGYLAWEQRILEQIRALRDMAENGQLDYEYRSFGIDAPRGGRWYNFEPSGYLECATEGTFGGWDAEDGDGRILVPGKVLVADAEGNLVSVEPSEVSRPVVAIDVVDWNTFAEFLECGQSYE